MYNSITFNWAYEFSSPLCVCAQKKKFIYSFVFNSKIEFHNLQFWMDCKWWRVHKFNVFNSVCVFAFSCSRNWLIRFIVVRKLCVGAFAGMNACVGGSIVFGTRISIKQVKYKRLTNSQKFISPTIFNWAKFCWKKSCDTESRKWNCKLNKQ